MTHLALWEILVPTVRPDNPNRFFRRRYHKIWDALVREIAGGLTILKPVKGEWVSPNGLIAERMIPVRICCTEEAIEKISALTAEYYNQQAILFYRISDQVTIRRYK